MDRHPDLTAAIHDAAETGHSQLRAERRGREYQLDFSRIESNGKVLGTVLLAFDVTEQAEAERMRREFTANVSHELKTPLQSIIGSAELLENGLVKPEDQPRFLNCIHQEADRLVALINDILRLSQLDEGGALPHEQVSVLELAQEAARSLTAQAAAQAVHISVTGTAGTVFGVRRLLYEIARNLCENAVKYNVPGGSVTVEVAETDRDVTLTVRDSGIGIPEGDQSRVFERFYRVDKSHSRAIGGTGLGLSIVKHAVAYHHGTLRAGKPAGEGNRDHGDAAKGANRMNFGKTVGPPTVFLFKRPLSVYTGTKNERGRGLCRFLIPMPIMTRTALTATGMRSFPPCRGSAWGWCWTRDATCPHPMRRQSWRNGTRMCTPPWASIRRTATASRTAT